MYSVSNAYKTALSRPAKVRRISGYIGNVPFDDDNLSRGSLEIHRRAADGNDVTLGYSFMADLSCVFRNINLTGEWLGKVITISEGLLIGEDTWEYVPLGIFTINRADHRTDGVYVEAYDNFLLMEKTFPYDTMTGTPYDFLSLICRDCGVTMLQTEAQIETLPNGQQSFVLYAENDIETYRDFLFWVAQTVACFCEITRDGKLALRKYGGDPVDTLTTTDRWNNVSFSDFTTKYTGVSVVDIEDQSTKYKGLPVDDGLTYNLGSNPLLQNMILDTVLGNILNELATIQYTPFDVSTNGHPAYDMGDCITFSGGLGAGKVGCLMCYDYSFRGEFHMFGYGSNPALSTSRNKSDKDISGLMSKAQGEHIQFYTFTNARPLTITDHYVQIIYIRFGSLKNSIVTFHAEIKVNAEITDELLDRITAEVMYVYNSSEVLYHPVETWIEGNHLLHLLYYFTANASEINKLSVRLKCDGEIYIDRANIQAGVWGQGLAASDSWDGYIELEENISLIPFSTTPSVVVDFEEELTVGTVTPHEIELEEYVGEIDFATTPSIVVPFEADLYVNKRFISELTWDEIEAYTWDEVDDEFIW